MYVKSTKKGKILAGHRFLWVYFQFFFLLVGGYAMASNQTEVLSPEQKAIIPIAAFTANGDVEKLKHALISGLNAGLTINEIKEVLIQMYAYAGFPRALTGLSAFMYVVEERKKLAKMIRMALLQSRFQPMRTNTPLARKPRLTLLADLWQGHCTNFVRILAFF